MTGAGEAEVSHHHPTTGFTALVEEVSMASELGGDDVVMEKSSEQFPEKSMSER